jgi:hypothetical protein
VLAVVSVAVSAIVCATTAEGAAALFRYDHELGRVARDTLWQAVEMPFPRRRVLSVGVRCYRDRSSFELAFEQRFGFPASRVVAYWAGGADVHLRNGTCQNVHAFLDGRRTVYTAAAYAILLHEALHRQGIRDERLATCFANDAVRWGSLRLGLDEEQALRARNLALTFTRVFAPPPYRWGSPDCLSLARRSDWIDHRGR